MEPGWSGRHEPGCPAVCLINHPAVYMAAVLLIAPGMAVGLLGLLVMMTL